MFKLPRIPTGPARLFWLTLTLSVSLVILLELFLPWLVARETLDAVLLPVSLHSAEDAVYGFEPFSRQIPAVGLNVIADHIRDDAAGESAAQQRLASVTAVLGAPISTATPDPGSLPMPSATPTLAATPLPPATATLRPSLTPSQTASATRTGVIVPTFTATNAPAPTRTATPSQTASLTPSQTASVTPTATATATATDTPTPTSTHTATATNTPTPTDTVTPTATDTLTPSVTSTSTPTFTPTAAVPVCLSPSIVTGLTPSDDTYIDADRPDHSNGGDPTIRVRPAQGEDHRGLIRFDLSAIPPEAIITGARLYLYPQSSSVEQVTFVYRLTSPWEENITTWNSPWFTPGGDFDASQAHALYVPGQRNCLIQLDVGGLVQGWVRGDYPNYGFLLLSTGTNQPIDYTSKDDLRLPEQAPRLEVSYILEPVTEAASPSLLTRLTNWLLGKSG